jgi:AcrR family transcriptional regulator
MRIDARRNRERLLTAARNVFVEQGVDAPLEDIAQRAGVGIATLYHRFPDRVALMRAVALHVLTQVAAEARAALAEESDSFHALARYLHRSLGLRIRRQTLRLLGSWEARVEFFRLLLRYLHLVGFALLVGAWVAQYTTGKLRVNVLMRTGLGTMIGTGLLLAVVVAPRLATAVADLARPLPASAPAAIRTVTGMLLSAGGVSLAVLVGLQLLGIGTHPPTPTLGGVLADALAYLDVNGQAALAAVVTLAAIAPFMLAGWALLRHPRQAEALATLDT